MSNGVKLIVANWKSNPTSEAEAKKLFRALKNTRAVICPPFVYLNTSCEIQDRKYKLCAQDYISPKRLKDLGVKYVIIGHSERRALGETEEIIEKKLRAALKAGLIPILCVGEKKGENAKKVISKQLKKNLKGVIIAYEPVWAISTSGGGFCPPEKANKIREFIKEKLNNKILYGGSVNSKIAKDYLKIGFDGLLIGKASLDAKEFKKIAKNA